MRRQRLRYAVIAAIVVFGGLATSALAQIPDSDGVIHACYHTSNGGIRVVNDASECGTSEEELTWFQSGSPGSVGAPGPQGEHRRDRSRRPRRAAGRSRRRRCRRNRRSGRSPGPGGPSRSGRSCRAARTCRRLRCFGRLREDGDRQGDDRHPPHDGRPSRPRSGSYIVNTSLKLSQSATTTPTRVSCSLWVGTNRDRGLNRLGPAVGASAMTMSLMVAQDISAPGGAEVRCRYARQGGAPRTVTAKSTQLVALAVGSITRQ